MQKNICSCSAWNMEPEDKNEKDQIMVKQFDGMTEK